MNSRLKKILGVAIAMFLMVLLFSGSAWAYLGSDENGTEGNLNEEVFKLKVGTGLAAEVLNMTNVAPGNNGSYVYHLENAGRLSGALSFSIPLVNNIAGTTGKFADGRGDLGRSVEMAFYLDMDTSGNWSQGDIGLNADCGTYRYQPSLYYACLDNYNGANWDNVTTLVSNSRLNLVTVWQIPVTSGNEIQGDSASFDISFTLRQAY